MAGGNSIKSYNKCGCLLKVETTINKPDLHDLKLKKPAIKLMAYYWYGLGCNSRYIETISDIDISILDKEVCRKYQESVTNAKGAKIPAPDHNTISNFRKDNSKAINVIILFNDGKGHFVDNPLNVIENYAGDEGIGFIN